MRHLDGDDLDAIGVLFDAQIVLQLDRIEERLHERFDLIMSTLEEVLAADAQLGDEINQVIAAVQADTALIAQLQAAIGSGNLTAEQQANVDNLFGQITAQHDQIVAALTPAAPAPVEAPPADAPA